VALEAAATGKVLAEALILTPRFSVVQRKQIENSETDVDDPLLLPPCTERSTRQAIYQRGRVESWRGSPLGPTLSVSRVSPFVPG